MEELILEPITYYLANPGNISPAVGFIWRLLYVIFATLSIVMAAMLVFLLFKNGYLKLRFGEKFTELSRAKPKRRIKIKKDWKKALKQIQEGREADRKLAIIEADDAIDKALSSLGYKGENLGEKLETASKEIIPNLDDLKRAHKARRDLVYDPGKDLSVEEATELLAIYEKTFRDLQLF